MNVVRGYKYTDKYNVKFTRNWAIEKTYVSKYPEIFFFCEVLRGRPKNVDFLRTTKNQSPICSNADKLVLQEGCFLKSQCYSSYFWYFVVLKNPNRLRPFLLEENFCSGNQNEKVEFEKIRVELFVDFIKRYKKHIWDKNTKELNGQGRND
jgi:hypothetical protein